MTGLVIHTDEAKHCYIFHFTLDTAQAALSRVGVFAGSPSLPLTWVEAAVVAEKIRTEVIRMEGQSWVKM